MQLQLAVKAGSVDEEDDQQGLAHFLEHMAFNGTKRFKPGELIAALESTGARLGPHVNAYTSFDETVYMFELPDRQAGARRKGPAGAGGLRRRHEPRSRSRSTRSAASSSRNGAAASAPARGCATSRFRSSTTSPSTPNGCRSASRRFSRASSRSGCAPSTRSGTAPTAWRVVAVGDIDVAADGGAGRKRVRRALTKPAAAAPRPHLRGAAADRAAGQDGDRSRSDAVIGLVDQQAAADAGGNGRRLPPRPGAPAGVPDAERAIRRAVAQARCAVPRRRRLRERLEPDDVDRGARRERAGRKDSGGPVVAW